MTFELLVQAPPDPLAEADPPAPLAVEVDAPPWPPLPAVVVAPPAPPVPAPLPPPLPLVEVDVLVLVDVLVEEPPCFGVHTIVVNVPSLGQQTAAAGLCCKVEGSVHVSPSPQSESVPVSPLSSSQRSPSPCWAHEVMEDTPARSVRATAATQRSVRFIASRSIRDGSRGQLG